MDLQAIIEAIQKKVEYKKVQEKAEGKLEAEKKRLQKLHLGKKSLSQFFSSKSKEEHLKHIEDNTAYLDKKIQSLALVNKIISVLLIHKEIPRFKQLKANKYEMIMRTFACAATQEFEFMVAQAKQIEEGLN